MTYAYCPEMNQVKPDHRFYDMECTPAYNWKHFFIETPLELKGRGITFTRKIEAKNYINPARIAYKEGWNEYKVTPKAYEKLEGQYKIVREMLLD